MDVEELMKNKKKHYRTFKIPKHRDGLMRVPGRKKGAMRTICAPDAAMKDAQKNILYGVLYKYKPTKYATGFRKGYNIVWNAKPHSKSIITIRVDIKDFFPSITREMILKRFRGKFELVADLCTLDDKLPQGAPTSPALANLVAARLDYRLAGLARKNDAVYTRYADDLIFSSATNRELNRMIPVIYAIVREEGFEPNEDKTKVMRRGQRMEVTGLTVNERPNVPRKKWRAFRAIMHNYLMDLRNGKIAPAKVPLQQLDGYAAFVMSVNRSKGEQALRKIAEIREEMRAHAAG